MVSHHSRGLIWEQLRRWEHAGLRLQQQAQHGGKRCQLRQRELPGRGIQLWHGKQLKHEVCIEKHYQEELSELSHGSIQLTRSRRG